MVNSFARAIRLALFVSAAAAASGCDLQFDFDPLPDDPPFRPPSTTGTGVVVGFPREKVDFTERIGGEPIGRLSVGDSVSFFMRFNAEDSHAPLERLLDTARSLAWKVSAANSGNGAFGDNVATIHTREAGRGILVARAAATSVEVGALIGQEYYGDSWVHSCAGTECIRVYLVIR